MSKSHRMKVCARLLTATVSVLAVCGPSMVRAQSTDAAAPVLPMYGKLSPFYGDVGPEYGKLSPFYGKLSPFWGSIDPEYGKLSPFYGKLSPWTDGNPFVPNADAASLAYVGADVDPFWGSGSQNPYKNSPSKWVKHAAIADFWTTEGQSWSKVATAWAQASTDADYEKVATKLKNLVLSPAAKFWGSAIAGGRPIVGPNIAGAAKVGQLTLTDIAADVFGKVGVIINDDGSVDAASLRNADPTERAYAFMTFYDQLMSYTGAAHVDWWMARTHWTPYLSQLVTTNTERRRPVAVGMIDMSVLQGSAPKKGAIYQYGADLFDNGHGAAVQSLISGSVDGSGVMGILPSSLVSIAVYNPYDDTGTTNWTDVGKGVDALSALMFGSSGADAPVGVFNASLGVHGSTLDAGWNTALASGAAHNHVLVVAAGNDGVTQSTDVPWNTAINPSLIVVGSIGVDGKISKFSNRPGEACLVDTATGACDKLKNHFIVAPGELILVSDGHGGVVRQTGTSLAAPLVTGAVALLQARWPWLAWHADALAEIILKSATPMGDHPGADPVYGVGELNILASQSPLNWGRVRYYMVDAKNRQSGKEDGVSVSVAALTTRINTGNQATWTADKLYYTAVEPVLDTARDFKIPLSTTLVGQKVADHAGLPLFQGFLTNSLIAYARSVGGAGSPKTGFANASSDSAPGGAFGFAAAAGPAMGIGGAEVRFSMTPSTPRYGFAANRAAVDTGLSVAAGATRFNLGYGEGAEALGLPAAFAATTGFGAGESGAAPVLRLASGGAYAGIEQRLASKVSVTIAATERRAVRDVALFGPVIQTTAADKYEARAVDVGVVYRPSTRLAWHLSATRLMEDAALLGVQSTARDVLGRGAATDALTLAVQADLGRGLTLAAIGTTARTDTNGAQALHTGAGGLISRAAEVALVKDRVLFKDDVARLTLSQPLHVTSGTVEYVSYGVVDRETGRFGLIHQSLGARSPTSPVTAQLDYAKALRSGGEFGAFLRLESAEQKADGSVAPAAVGGVKLKLRF